MSLWDMGHPQVIEHRGKGSNLSGMLLEKGGDIARALRNGYDFNAFWLGAVKNEVVVDWLEQDWGLCQVGALMADAG